MEYHLRFLHHGSGRKQVKESRKRRSAYNPTRRWPIQDYRVLDSRRSQSPRLCWAPFPREYTEDRKMSWRSQSGPLRAISVLPFLVPLSCIVAWTAETNAPFVKNFHQVNEHLYRGAQPTPEGIKSLAKMGVRTVMDLRRGDEHGKWEQHSVEQAGMHYVHIPMNGLAAPSDEQISTIMALLGDASAWPVFIHCKRGADRTGTVVACYRILHDKWPNQKALIEAKFYGMSFLEHGMQQYIMHLETHGRQASIRPGSMVPAANSP